MATAQLNESLFGRAGRNIYKSGLLIKKSSIVSSTGEDRDKYLEIIFVVSRYHSRISLQMLVTKRFTTREQDRQAEMKKQNLAPK